MKIKKKLCDCFGKGFGNPRPLTRLTHTPPPFQKKVNKKTKHGGRPNLVRLVGCV